VPRGRDSSRVPADPADRRAAFDALIAQNEAMADGGFYPVGPLGETHLWHGGIHVIADAGTPLFAPFAGRIVAARLGSAGDIGSTSFVLLRHDLAIGTTRVRFFTLFFHILDESTVGAASDPRPVWWPEPGQKWHFGEVVELDLAVRAGDLVGRVGIAGPHEHARAQVHIEMFADREILASLGVQRDVIDGHGGGRYCTAPQVLDRLDSNHDGAIAGDELRQWYRTASDADRAAMRRVVFVALSEWSDAAPTWRETVAQAFPAERDAVMQLVDSQVYPTLWWTDEVAARTGLPRSAEVFHYHPIELIAAIDDVIDHAGPAQGGAGSFNASDAHEAPAGLTVDRDDPRLDDFATTSELSISGTAVAPEQPTLEEMAAGFSDDQ
jgi:hypothetical protein